MKLFTRGALGGKAGGTDNITVIVIDVDDKTG
jgi:hypothetical protein